MALALIAIEFPDNIMFTILENTPSAFIDEQALVVPDPDNPDVATTTTKVGVFTSNEDAQKAAQEYAAQRGFEVEGWRNTQDGLEADAHPAKRDA